MNMKIFTTAVVLAMSMALTAAAANFARPTKYLADSRPSLNIGPSIPSEFAGWKLLPTSSGVVNPQQEASLNAIYSELINRTYLGPKGERVMLSIAYGKNQSDSFQVHKPEICYPAQGFQLRSNTKGVISTQHGDIPVRRIETFYGTQRPEPVTYWTTLGDHTVESGTDKKLKEMRYAMQGYIADGLLFRVSSIDPDSERAFEVQARFASDLLASMDSMGRARLAGLSN